MTEQATDEQARFSEAVRRREEREAYLDEGGEAYPEEEEPPRDALLELSRRLRSLAEEGFGAFEVEARTAWLLAIRPFRSPEQLRASLAFAEEVRSRLEHRSSQARPVRVLSELRLAADAQGDDGAVAAIDRVAALLRDRLEALREKREAPALVAAELAVERLLSLVDALRERAPEHLR